jgi:hypothetical protein
MDNVDLTAYSKEDIEKARRYPKVIAVFRIRIRMFLGLPDMDPDLSINKQKIKKNINL